MKNRSLLSVLLLLFLGMVAVAVWQNVPQTVTAAVPTLDLRDISTVFKGWSDVDIQALRLDDPFSDKDLTLTRVDAKTWQLVGSQDELDQEVATKIIRTVAFIPYTDIIKDIPKDQYVNYGLTTETIWLQIQVILNNQEQHVIAIGRRAPVTDGGYYALVDDLTDIYVLNRGAVDYLGIYLQTYQSLE